MQIILWHSERTCWKTASRCICNLKEKPVLACRGYVNLKAVCGWQVEIRSISWLKNSLPLCIIVSPVDHLEIIVISKRLQSEKSTSTPKVFFFLTPLYNLPSLLSSTDISSTSISESGLFLLDSYCDILGQS